MGFVRQHLLFGAVASPTFLAAKFLQAVTLRLLAFLLTGFEFVQQELKGEHTVESLLARGLALHLKSGWPVKQHHAGGRLVDVLPTVSAGTNEGLFNFDSAHAERRHAAGELRFLSRAERVHGGSVIAGGDAINLRKHVRVLASVNGTAGKTLGF